MASTPVGRSPAERYQPSARLLNQTANTGFSYLTPQVSHQQQRHLPAARSISSDTGAAGYNSLPRKRCKNKAPSNLSQARRDIVNSALQDYLKSLNSMTRSIVLETETVEKEHQCNWTKLDTARKENLVNDHFVPADVRLHYENERAASCCSFSSGWSLGHEASQGQYPLSYDDDEGFVAENRPLHLSQPDDWEELPGPGLHQRQLSRSTKELMYSNNGSSMASEREDLSLSQPSLYGKYDDPVGVVQPTNFNRLHKKQLSFRPSHKQHAVRPRQIPQQKYVPLPLPPARSRLNSDGESPRTSDEDYEGARWPQKNTGLGFQRTKLRSYSMRSKKTNTGTNTGIRNSANLRSSVRIKNILRTSPDGEESKFDSSCKPNCRPSHYHNYSTTSNETDFDEEIDMPDEALMVDNVPHDNSTDETESKTGYKPFKAVKHTRARRSFRKNTPERSHKSSETKPSNHSHSTFLAPSDVSREPSNLYRSNSKDSLDMDSVSIAPSDISKYPMDDEDSVIDPSRMTPDSILSVSSYSSRPRSNAGEASVFRNSKGKRGGSRVKVATSDFADRHTQFRTNMLQRQMDGYQTSASTTRAVSPASSISSIPAHQQDTSSYLKVPDFNYSSSSKHDSIAESTTSDMPRSPDPLSLASSPPCTPLAVNYTSHSELLRKSLASVHHEHRESGYISSSSESFPVPVRQ